VQGKFKRVARLEYNDPARMGFLSYGDQSSGVYFSWPGTTFCPTSFDPRFRPWYVSAVSGPKDVVIIIDKSGSMTTQSGSSSRWSQAQAAAKEVLGTLTKFDYANIVTFSDSASSFDDTTVLQAVSESKLKEMRDWIDSVVPAGGTNFYAGFQKAFSILSASQSATSGCNKVVLFLTDGQDTSNMQMSALRALNQMNARIFTYSFGNNAAKVLPKEIACQNNGIWYHVNDGADIMKAMSGYYMYYAGALADTKQIRWTMYKEFTTQNDLITGCLPAYNRNGQSVHLIGVVCMDVSIIMDVQTFRSKSDYAAANTAMEQAASTCTMVTHSKAALEALRSAVAPESACDYSPTANRAHGSHAQWRLLLGVLALPLLWAGIPK